MKKQTLIYLIVGLLITPTLSFGFSDVPVSNLNSDAISYVRDQGIVSGYEDGSYRPNNTINRAEFTKIVIEAQFDRETINNCGNGGFSDVPSDQWFAKYVCIAKLNGIIGGYPDGTFKPAQNIAFVEAAKIIAVAFEFEVGSDDLWYKPFVEVLGSKKAIPTSIDRFEKSITRGEMAEMIYRLKEGVVKESHNFASLSGEQAVEQVEDEQAEMKMTYQGQVLAGSNSPFLDFKQADYEEALKSDKPILLYFFAKWCPICHNELNNGAYPAFNEFGEEGFVAFRVNYRDSDTEEYEEDLAREFGVAYQHTKVVVRDGEKISKSPESWSKQRYLDEFALLLQ